VKKSLSKALPIILITFLFFALHSPAWTQDAKPFLGTWNGALSLMGQELEIVLKFNLNEDKSISGTIDVPAQGAFDITLGNFELEGKKISFIIDYPDIPGEPTFNGELDEAGTKISGTFTQSGMDGEFSVEKAK
jgi:hypothetical protein